MHFTIFNVNYLEQYGWAGLPFNGNWCETSYDGGILAPKPVLQNETWEIISIDLLSY